MDEVEFRNALLMAASLIDKVDAINIQTVLTLFAQMLGSLDERITELQLSEDEC